MNFAHPTNGNPTVIDPRMPQPPAAPIDGSPGAQTPALTPEQGQAAMKNVWNAVDGVFASVPWYFTLAGGIAVGMYLSKKLR